MINLLNIDSKTEIRIRITDSDDECIISTTIAEVEYAPNRTPQLVDLVVNSSNNKTKFPIGSKLIIGLDDIVENTNYKFLLFSPTKLEPNRTLHYTAKIQFLN